MIVAVKLSQRQTYVKSPKCWITQGNWFEPVQNVSMCLGDADSRREGRNISRTTLSSLWLRNPDFKT